VAPGTVCLNGRPWTDKTEADMAAGKRRRRPRKLPLTVEAILAWADAHQARTGAWPSANSGPVAEAPGVHWHAIDLALAQGLRSLPGGDSLSQLLRRTRGLEERRGRYPRRCPPESLARRRRAARMRALGLTQREIGRRLGVSHQAVSHMLRRAGREG
jgi:hypothetical protein